MKLLQKAGNSNSLAGNSFLIFLIRFFPSLATLLVVIFYSRLITPDQYGAYQNFWVDLYLLGTVATLGIPAFVLTYSSGVIKVLLNRLKAKQHLLIISWVFLIALVFAWLRHTSSGMLWYIPLSFFLVYSFNAIIESLLIVSRSFRYLLTVNLLYTAGFLILHAGVVNNVYDIECLFFFLLILGLARLAFSLLNLVAGLKRVESNAETEYTTEDIRSLWMHIGIYDVSQRVFTWIDKFIIARIFTTGISAVYFNATFDIPFLPLLLGAVGSAALIDMSSYSKKGNREGAVAIANQSARLLSAVVFPLFFFLYLFRYELFTVVLTEKYAESVPIFAVAVLIVPLRAYNFTSILQNRHKGRVINIGAVLDIVIACVLMYPLYQLWGLKGIAASFIISSYLQGGYYLYHTSKVLEVPVLKLIPVRNWVVKLIVFAAIFVAGHYITVLFFTPPIVLTLGSLLLVIALLVAMLSELRASKKIYGQPIQEN